MPAAFCGVVGLKPTFGRISLRGARKIAWTLDHAGPFGRTVSDARTIFGALASTINAGSEPIERPPILAVIRESLERATPYVRVVTEKALDRLERAGARIVDAAPIDGIEQHLAAFMITIIAEGSLNFEDLLRDVPEGIAPRIRAELELGAELRAADYLRAQRFRSVLRGSVLRALEKVDALVTPTMPTEPWTWKQLDELEEFVVFWYTAPFSLTGHPALSIPVPTNGLPSGLQLIGHYGGDERLLDVAEWIEGAFAT